SKTPSPPPVSHRGWNPNRGAGQGVTQLCSSPFLICAFKRDTALCDPDPGAPAPNQFACQLGCGNAVRTDTHAQAAREQADRLDARAALMPQPLGDRLRLTAARFRALADAHDSGAQSAEEAIA
ncbi:hypothetical protein AB0D42_40960, partial [Streptomyces sp. NPDC048304]